MDALSEKSVDLLFFLLPGFLAAWVFYGLTAHPRKEAFERLIQALIFTFVVKVEVIGIHKLWWVWWHKHHRPLGYWTDSKELVWSGVGALLTGIVVAYLANSDRAHALLRKCRVTKRTSYPSEWYSGLHRFKRELILHLKGSRRLRGWADEWPDQPDRGHFLIDVPQWVDENGNNFPQSQVERLLVPATDVEMIEFLVPNTVVSPADVTAIQSQVKALAALQKQPEIPKEKTDGQSRPSEPAGE